MNKEFNLENIIDGLARDNEKSLRELFNYYYPRLYNFSKSFIKIEDSIDDILQDVFIKIWQNRKHITRTDTFNAYIFTITKNLLLNELRRCLNHKHLKDELYELSTAHEYSFLETTTYADLELLVNEVVDELPDRQKQIFIMSRSKGMSNKEIAKKLNISTKTVEYHITLSIKYLKQKMSVLGFGYLLFFYLFL
ncbi:RNA polymerase sigma-70 factor [Saccharicrinis fermentans]|uniref:RNA polymerase sigma factor n=1 Tax=Saccharicrinis fermentans DSM 9555 = JCM 21142 TaxID=869213 RepID=W7XV88_9BACT|nr:RNA polymerase sigma-70 factor [Saccharicrinis fermentans]GAF02000.1 RNA polymerase sigma factor CnrH [Saccharicrinis fermentans DSM 9555 = JCM 21142]